MPDIPATIPTVIDATFPSWQVASFQVSGDGLASYGEAGGGPVSVRVGLVKFRTRPDGVRERSPSPSDRSTLDVPDLYALAAANPKVAAAVAALAGAVAEVAASQGKL